jgi:hypothetical protein
VLNVVLAIVGIGAVYIYRGQLSVMRGTLEEMRRESDIAHRPWISPESAKVVQINPSVVAELTIKKLWERASVQDI